MVVVVVVVFIVNIVDCFFQIFGSGSKIAVMVEPDRRLSSR